MKYQTSAYYTLLEVARRIQESSGGNVFFERRWTTNPKEYVDLFKKDNRIHAWFVHCYRMTEELNRDKRYVKVKYYFKIEGFYSFKANVTDFEFTEKLDVIREAFRKNLTFDLTVVRSNLLQIDENGYDYLSEELCHHCVASFVAEDEFYVEDWNSVL